MILLAALLATSTPALAEDGPAPATSSSVDARTLFRNGDRLFSEGLYEDAIAAWKKGYELEDRPLFLLNIANAYERLGDLEQALSYLNRYRAFAPEAEASALDRRIANLTQRHADQKAAASVVEPVAPPPVEPAPVEPAPITVPVEPAKKPIDLPAVALLGAGGLGLGVGLVAGLQASGARAGLSDHCVDAPSGLMCTSEAAPLLARDRTLSVVADVGFLVGVLATGGGVVLTLIDAGPVDVAVAPNGVALAGKF